MDDSPAAIASLTAMRELLALLKNKGVVSSTEIVTMLNAIDPGVTAETEFDRMLYRAYLWLKTPHLADSIVEALGNSRES